MAQMSSPVKWLIALGIGVLLLTVVALLMETNPPVTGEPAWDSPQTHVLAQRACFDCHSNETVWPWYDRLPGSSWLAVVDTIRGRRRLNFSKWQSGWRSRDVAEVIQRGSMPPSIYTLMHPNAILTDQEKQQLITGLQKLAKIRMPVQQIVTLTDKVIRNWTILSPTSGKSFFLNQFALGITMVRIWKMAQL